MAGRPPYLIKIKGAELISEINVGNAMLIPVHVELKGGEETLSDISGEITTTSGKIYKLGSTTTFSSNGKIHVAAGSELMLFPSVTTDAAYTIVHKTTTTDVPDVLIDMQSGSYLSIFGMQFFVSIGSESDAETSMNLFGMSKIAASDNDVSIVLSYKKQTDSDKYTFSMKIGSNCKVGFLESEDESSDEKEWGLILITNNFKTEVKDKDGKIITPADHPDISFTGTIEKAETTSSVDSTKGIGKVGLEVSLKGFLMIDARGSEYLVQGHVDIEKGNVSYSMGKYPTYTNIDVNADVKATAYAQAYYIGLNAEKTAEVRTLIVTVDKAVMQTGDLKVNVSTGTETGKIRFSLIDKGDFAFSVDSIKVNLAAILEKGEKIDLVITGLNLSGKNVNMSGAIDMTGFPLSMISDLKIVIESVSMSLTSANAVFKNVERITGDKEIEVTFVKDLAFKLQNVNIAVAQLTNMKIEVGEFSLKGYVGKYLFRFAGFEPMQYDLIVDLSIKDVSVISNLKIPLFGKNTEPLSGILSTTGKVKVSVGSIDVSAKIVYDGVEKGLQINIENLKANADFDQPIIATAEASIGKIYAKSNIPMRFLDNVISLDKTFPIEITTALIGVGSVEAELQATNLTGSLIMEEQDEENGLLPIRYTPEVKADSFEITLNNGVRYKEFHMKFSDNLKFDIDKETWDEGETYEKYFLNYYALTVECGNVEGYYTSYTGSKNSFSVTDSPKVGIGMMQLNYKEYGSDDVKTYKFPYMGVLNIYDGSAKFEGGMLPITIRVGTGASFSANGLTAPMFIFDAGCVKSGTVVLDPNAFELPTVYKYYFEKYGDLDFKHIYRTAMLIDNGYVIRTPTVFGETETDYLNMITAYEGGYKLIFDLSDITSGKIEANTGKELPESYSNETGFSMELPDKNNKQSGTFTITKNAGDVTYLDMTCTGKNYVLSYADDFVEKKEYQCGAEVTLAGEKTKEGYKFLGWSDGTGTIYTAGSKYIMPARDVTMTPVYNKVLTATPEVKDGTVTVSVDSQFVTFDVPTGEWNEMTVKTANATVTISNVAYEELKEVTGTELDKLMFGCVETDTVYNEDLAQLVSGKNLYAMKMYFVDDTGEKTEIIPASYDGFTEMQVTVFLKTDKNLNNVKIQYVNPNGFLEEVKVDSWEKVDGGYNITFTVTHFSIYAVEPSYTDNTMLIIAAVIIVLVLIGLGVWYYKTRQKA